MFTNIDFCIPIKTGKLLQSPPMSTLIIFYSKDILQNSYVYFDLEATNGVFCCLFWLKWEWSEITFVEIWKLHLWKCWCNRDPWLEIVPTARNCCRWTRTPERKLLKNHNLVSSFLFTLCCNHAKVESV